MPCTAKALKVKSKAASLIKYTHFCGHCSEQNNCGYSCENFRFGRKMTSKGIYDGKCSFGK